MSKFLKLRGSGKKYDSYKKKKCVQKLERISKYKTENSYGFESHGKGLQIETDFQGPGKAL